MAFRNRLEDLNTAWKMLKKNYCSGPEKLSLNPTFFWTPIIWCLWKNGRWFFPVTVGCHFCLQRGPLASCVGNLFCKLLRWVKVAAVLFYAAAWKRGELFIICLSQHKVWWVVSHFHSFRVFLLCDQTFQRGSLLCLMPTNKMFFGPGKKLWECPQRCLGDISAATHV